MPDAGIEGRMTLTYVGVQEQSADYEKRAVLFDTPSLLLLGQTTRRHGPVGILCFPSVLSPPFLFLSPKQATRTSGVTM